jgi:hypothetical protein
MDTYMTITFSGAQPKFLIVSQFPDDRGYTIVIYVTRMGCGGALWMKHVSSALLLCSMMQLSVPVSTVEIVGRFLRACLSKSAGNISSPGPLPELKANRLLRFQGGLSVRRLNCREVAMKEKLSGPYVITILRVPGSESETDYNIWAPLDSPLPPKSDFKEMLLGIGKMITEEGICCASDNCLGKGDCIREGNDEMPIKTIMYLERRSDGFCRMSALCEACTNAPDAEARKKVMALDLADGFGERE